MVPEQKNKNWVIGISGASGICYALRLMEVLALDLRTSSNTLLHVIFSEAALRVMKEEDEIKLSYSSLSPEKLFARSADNIRFYNPRDIGASLASGSFRFDGMVVVPCSMATLGMMANACGVNLIHRCADVALKEKRKLIIVPRETPLHTIHLENMLKLSQSGASIVPAMPGFYSKPKQVSDLVDMQVMKILDVMDLESNLVPRWGENKSLNQNKSVGVEVCP